MSDASHPYRGARMALLTQHGKEAVLGPLVREAFAADLVLVSDFDTDTLGTFTRDVPRAGTQLEAARTKARLASERSGLPLGIGSEGAFTPGPFGFDTYDLELVVLVDRARRIEVVGRAYEPGQHFHTVAAGLQELRDFATRAGFPEHGLVVRPNDEHDPRVWKGLRAWSDLEAAFVEAQALSRAGQVFVESDLRAHQNPSRMAVIARATADLVARLARRCPQCELPGFGRIDAVPGLPCRDCGLPTAVPVADRHGCVRCEHRELQPRGGPETADPGRCDRCNP